MICFTKSKYHNYFENIFPGYNSLLRCENTKDTIRVGSAFASTFCIHILVFTSVLNSSFPFVELQYTTKHLNSYYGVMLSAGFIQG